MKSQKQIIYKQNNLYIFISQKITFSYANNLIFISNGDALNPPAIKNVSCQNPNKIFLKQKSMNFNTHVYWWKIETKYYDRKTKWNKGGDTGNAKQ